MEDFDDGIGTGRIDLSGMTWEEYTEWESQRLIEREKKEKDDEE